MGVITILNPRVEDYSGRIAIACYAWNVTGNHTPITTGAFENMNHLEELAL